MKWFSSTDEYSFYLIPTIVVDTFETYSWSICFVWMRVTCGFEFKREPFK